MEYAVNGRCEGNAEHRVSKTTCRHDLMTLAGELRRDAR
jgi:hypothetical protein